MSVYEYTKLADLTSAYSATKINCYGIVSALDNETKSLNPKTQQDQWQLVVQLVDESCGEGQSITCRLFADKQNALPCVQRLGDILRLHRVPRTAEGFLGGRIGLAGFHAVVWDSEHGGSLKPRGATSTAFTIGKDEEQRCMNSDSIKVHQIYVGADGQRGHRSVVPHENYAMEERNARVVQLTVTQCSPLNLNELRLWWLQRNASMRPSKKRFSSLSRFQYGDIICQVIGVITSLKNSIFVRVWDGTRISFPVFFLPDNEIVADQSSIDENLAKSAAGFSQDIICYGDLALEARDLTPGDIVYVTNLHALKKTSSTLVGLTMHSRNTEHPRGFRTLSRDDPQAQLLLRDLQAIGGQSTSPNDAASSTSNDADASAKQTDSQVFERHSSEDHDGATASTSTAVDASTKERSNCEIQQPHSTLHQNANDEEDEYDDDDEEEEVTYSQAPFAVLRREMFAISSAIEEVEDPTPLYSPSPPPLDDAVAEAADGTTNNDQVVTDCNLVDSPTIIRKRKSDSDEFFSNPLVEKESRSEDKTANGDGNLSVDHSNRHHRRVTCDQLIVNLHDWKDGDFINIIDEFRLNDSVWDSLFPSRAHGQSDHLFYVECDRCGHRWRLADSRLQPGEQCRLCSKEDASSSSMLRLTVELIFIRTVGKQSAVFLCREPLVKQLIPSFSSAPALFTAFTSQDKQFVARFWKEAEILCKQRFSVSSAQVITVCSMRQFLVHKINIAA